MTQEISQLMDGDLEQEAADRLIGRLKRDDDSREAWDTYHLIGDALRNEWLASAKLQQRILDTLADEPTVMAPRRFKLPLPLPRLALAAAGSVATIAIVAWMATESIRTPAPIAPIANSQPIPGTPEALPTIVNLESYLQAHQDFAPAPAGFRPVSLESPGASKP